MQEMDLQGPTTSFYLALKTMETYAYCLSFEGEKDPGQMHVLAFECTTLLL